MKFFWNKNTSKVIKKNGFVIIWVATLLVVIGHIGYLAVRGNKPDGVIIRSGDSNKPVVHIASSRGSRYLPSPSKNAASITDPSTLAKADPSDQINLIDQPLPSFLTLPAADHTDQTREKFKSQATIVPPSKEILDMTLALPAAQSHIMVNQDGDVVTIDTNNQESDTDLILNSSDQGQDEKTAIATN